MTIDFSCKHDILIRNFDGSLQPMDEPFFEAEKIADDTWKILSDGDYSYLVAGSDKAFVIDSGYGAGNIREFCQTLTGVPVSGIINTHHHFDHTANNAYFDVAYMDERGVELSTVPYPSFAGIDFPRDYRVVTVGDGTVFDLGGRTLEVFQIPDHTDDGIAMLDRREKLLFSGDEFMRGKFLAGTVEHWKKCLDKLMANRQDIGALCGGEGGLPVSILDDQYEIVNAILAGDTGAPAGGPGDPGVPGGPGPLPDRTQPADGVKVYARKFPHPEDVRHGPRNGAADMRCVERNGYRVMFDASRVFDR